MESLEKEPARKPLYSVLENEPVEKRVALKNTKNNDNGSQLATGEAVHDSNHNDNYEKRNAFRHLALNGARGFGKR